MSSYNWDCEITPVSIIITIYLLGELNFLLFNGVGSGIRMADVAFPSVT